MIIDSHAHLGYDEVFDMGINEDELVTACDTHGIYGAVVQPLIQRPYIEDTRQIHNRIYRLCQKYPGRFWGMISMNPHFRPEDFDAEAERCVKELGFVGIKMTPAGHGVNPSKKNGMHVFEVAQKLNIPVMVHTGSGIPFSDPINLLPAARAFPDVRMVIAHGGGELMATQAILLAEEFSKVYIEPSWSSVLTIGAMLKAVGPKKLMFSSDLPVNIPVELAKYRSMITDENDLEQILSGTAIEVFGLNITG